jgi:hypothetical protein
MRFAKSARLSGQPPLNKRIARGCTREAARPECHLDIIRIGYGRAGSEISREADDAAHQYIAKRRGLEAGGHGATGRLMIRFFAVHCDIVARFADARRTSGGVHHPNIGAGTVQVAGRSRRLTFHEQSMIRAACHSGTGLKQA